MHSYEPYVSQLVAIQSVFRVPKRRPLFISWRKFGAVSASVVAVVVVTTVVWLFMDISTKWELILPSEFGNTRAGKREAMKDLYLERKRIGEDGSSNNHGSHLNWIYFHANGTISNISAARAHWRCRLRAAGTINERLAQKWINYLLINRLSNVCYVFAQLLIGHRAQAPQRACDTRATKLPCQG